MRRGFAYSLAALALALAVAQAAIMLSTASAGAAYERTSQKDAIDFAAFSEGVVGLQSSLLVSCGLASAAAKDYEESTNFSFVNESCVLSFLVLNGNVTDSNCAGEPFVLLETSNKSYSLSSWQQGIALRRIGTIKNSGTLLTTYATANATHTTCTATASVSVATLDNTTSITRNYTVTRIVANP